MSDALVYVGIDVAKDHLDVHALPAGRAWRVANAPQAIDELTSRLVALAPTLVALEATGGHEHAVAGALATAGLAVAVMNPRSARLGGAGCATSLGPRASLPRPTGSTPA